MLNAVGGGGGGKNETSEPARSRGRPARGGGQKSKIGAAAGIFIKHILVLVTTLVNFQLW